MKPVSKFIAGLRIVLADDEPFNLSLVASMVRDIGCSNIALAANGGHALQAISDIVNPPDVLIVDFNMPELNGLQLLKMARTGEAGCPRDLRTLMLTGSSDFSLVGAAMALDVDAFLIKPVSQLNLAARLEKLAAPPSAIKSVADYQKVDIDSVTRNLLSRKPVGTPRPKTETAKKGREGIKVKLDAITEGAVLAEDIFGPGGELVLGRNTRLTDRLIKRMKELRGVLDVEYVYTLKQA